MILNTFSPKCSTINNNIFKIIININIVIIQLHIANDM